MKKNLIVFGTRPEAIKMAPLVKAFLANKSFETKVCITAQHREMLDQVLSFFEITADYDLNVMKPNQNLYSLTSDILLGLKPVLEDFKPDYVYVHGDTTTTFSASLASFYFGAKVCHVEAGLRTNDKLSPFPEEINRSLTGRLADFHFAPTELSKMNLVKENVNENEILITGNTVIDALSYGKEKVSVKGYSNKEVDYLKEILIPGKRIILVTGHRRENHGQGFINICRALKQIALDNSGCQVIYPVHLNPNVQKPVFELLDGIQNVHLVNPVAYPAFIWLMNKSHIIISDSGGIQEEAPSLGKPVLVMRETTERPEAVIAGTVILVGIDEKKIVSEANRLLTDEDAYNEMSLLHNPYGDGLAAQRIVDFIEKL